MKLEESINFFKNIWTLEILHVDGGSITLGSLLVGLFFLTVGVFVSKALSRRLSSALFQKFSIDRNAKHIIESASFYLLLVIATLFALKLANIPITVFTLVGGALAIAIGFGSQNIFNNFISGIILMIERPIKVGDFVEVDGVFGEIENIGMRSTSLQSYGRKYLIVPNSYFLEKNVLNWTYKGKVIRTFILIGVAYGTPIKRVEEVLKGIFEEANIAKVAKRPMVLFTDFGESSLNLSLEFEIILKQLNSKRVIESNLRYRISEVFQSEGIEIPFPQRDFNLKDQRPLTVNIVENADI